MFSQLIVNGLIAGSVYAVLGSSFLLVFLVTRSFLFTHALVFCVAPYAVLAVGGRLTTEGAFGFLVGPLASTAAGLAIWGVVLRPLAARRAPQLVVFLASLGVYVVGQNLISLVFTDATLSLRQAAVTVGHSFLGARITTLQIGILVAALPATLVAETWLRFSSAGRVLRAMSDNPDLGFAVGLPVERTALLAIAIGSALAGCAGLMYAVDRDVVPTMGMAALFPAIVALLLAGPSRPWRVAVAGAVFGLCQHLSGLVLPLAWQDAVVFAVLVAVLLVRPRGLASAKVAREV